MNKVWVLTEIKDFSGSISMKYSAKEFIVGIYSGEKEARSKLVPDCMNIIEYDLDRTYFDYPEHRASKNTRKA